MKKFNLVFNNQKSSLIIMLFISIFFNVEQFMFAASKRVAAPAITKTSPEVITAVVAAKALDEIIPVEPSQDISVSTENTTTTPTPPEPEKFDLEEFVADLTTIKDKLSTNEQKLFQTAIGSSTEKETLIFFITKNLDQLATLPSKEYDDLYETITKSTIGRVTFSWTTQENWKALFPLTKLVYESFPYQSSGWLGIGGNKNEIKNKHKGICTELDNNKEYPFVEIDDETRPKYIGPATDSQAVPELEAAYSWPDENFKYETPFEKKDLANLKSRLEQCEKVLKKIKASKDIIALKITLARLAKELELAKLKKDSEAGKYDRKGQKRFLEAIEKSYNFSSQDSLKNTLKISKWGQGFTDNYAYELVIEFLDNSTTFFSKNYKVSLKKLTEEIETARKNYGTEESENE
jgi:hypothetical protein